MTTIGIIGLGLTGTMRMTWVRDELAHVFYPSLLDECEGTWTGRACPDFGLVPGANIVEATLRHLVGRNKAAESTWEAPDDLAAAHDDALSP